MARDAAVPSDVPEDVDREIADAVAGLVLRLDGEGRVTFASAGGRELIGAACAALHGRILREVVHPQDRDALAAAGACVGAPHPGTVLRLRGEAGDWVPLEATIRAVPGGRHRVALLRAAPESGRSADLRTSRDHYRALVDTLPQLVWMERADTGETVYVNQAFEAYCGSIPTTREARTDRFHPADAGQIASAYTRTRARSREVQGRVRDRAGLYRWHQFVFRPLHVDGELIGWLGSALDIDEIVTSREALEEKSKLLRLAQEAAGAGLFDADLSARDVILSPESAGRHGLPADRPAVIGLAEWVRLLLPADRAPTLRAIRAAASAGRTFDVEFRVPAADGGTHWIQAIGRPHQDRSGAVARIIGLTLDVTARKAGERALIEAKAAAEAAKAAAEAARAQAERANAAKTDFLSAMSHEIRTPLNAVIGFAGLLAGSDRLDGDLRRYADLARAAGENLRTVVDDILDFSSVEAGAVRLHPEPFAVRALVDACLGIVGNAAAAKGLDTAMAVDGAIPEDLVGDAGRMRQILLNLLNNAVKFTRRGSVTVGVRHEGRTPWGERIRFSVTDTGIGIAPEQQDRLFRRFSQADSSIHRDYGGTGLGLAISRRLVELMGGTIGLDSEAGRGATFWFTLTLPRPEAGMVAAAAAQPEPRRTGRILLAEDIEINRELACTVLRAGGHVVECACDGIAAVRAVEAGSFDLVLMDVQMPQLDGMMATRLIRCLPGPAARIPVIAMTANVLPDQIRAFHEAGMDDHFAKPFQPHELLSAVARWLDGTRHAGDGTDAEPGVAPEPTIDRARYEDNVSLIAPETLNRLLGQFHARVQGAFPGGGATETERAGLRAEAHALCAAAGMLGFLPFSRACAALETATGTQDFDALLAHARGLAADAAVETLTMLETMPPSAREAR